MRADYLTAVVVDDSRSHRWVKVSCQGSPYHCPSTEQRQEAAAEEEFLHLWMKRNSQNFPNGERLKPMKQRWRDSNWRRRRRGLPGFNSKPEGYLVHSSESDCDIKQRSPPRVPTLWAVY